MDALSVVLDRFRLRSTIFSRAWLTSPWAVNTRGMAAGIFHGVVEGGAWLRLEEGDREVVALAAGDVVFLPHGSPHTLFDTPEATPCPISEHSRREPGASVASLRLGGGGDMTRLLCGSVRWEGEATAFLSAALPRLIVLRGDTSRTPGMISGLLEVVDAEIEGGAPGADVLITRLADVLLVNGLRAWIAAAEEAPRGSWLGGLRDPRIARALARVHARPAEAWTLEQLAAEAGMSRSAFCARFTEIVGEPPTRHLTRWRMELAARYLHAEDLSVAEVAERVGYGSEFAFSKAFKRHTGHPPGAYRRASPLSPGRPGTAGLSAAG